MTLNRRERSRDEAVCGFGLPTWLENACPYCEKHMPLEAILGFGVEMGPKMFGNFAITYICPSCSSMCELHYVNATPLVEAITSFLTLENEPSKPKTREQLIKSSEHNLDVK